MSGKYNLRKAVDVAQVVKQDVQEEIPAVLGITIGGKKTVEIPTRPGYVYAQVRGNLSELVSAYNDQVSPVYGLHVLLTRDKVDKGRYRVKGRDLGKYQSWGSTNYLPKHGAQHSFNPDNPGGDITWIWGKQFMPLMAVPSGSNGGPNVVVYGSPYNLNGDWLFSGDTGTVNIAPDFNPTGAWARMVLVFVDEFGNPQVTGSSIFFDTALTGTSDITPYVPEIDTASYLPIAAIRLVSGTSIINWNNIYDFRPHFRLNNGVGHVIQDDGVSQTQRDYLNFIGAGFVVYDNAGKTNVSGTAALPALTAERVLYTEDDGSISTNNYFRYQHDTNVDNLLIGGLGAIPGTQDYYNIVSVMDYSGNGSWNDCYAGFAFENTPSFHFFHGSNTEASPGVSENGDVTSEIGFYHFGTGSLYFTYGLASYIRTKALGLQVDAFGSEMLFGVTNSGTATSREALKLWGEQAWFYKDIISQNNGAYYWGDPRVTGSWRSLVANDRIEFQEKIAENWTTRGWSNTGSFVYYKWDTDAPPISPSAQDDEFSDNSFNSGTWTEYDYGSLQTLVEDDYGLLIGNFNGDGSADKTSGIYQAIPGGDFTVDTKIGMNGYWLAAAHVGLALYENGGSGTSNFVAALYSTNATVGTLRVATWSSWDTWDSDQAIRSPANVPVTHVYFRITRASTTYNFYYSGDGKNWIRMYTTGSLSITPLHIGPIISNKTNGLPASGRVEFFRYINSAVDIHTPCAGRKMGIYG